jgi:hypothetical protein
MWKTILISLLFIIIAQYSFQYLKDTLTPRKTKYLAGFHKQKFEEIINELREAKNKPLSEPDMESELLEFAQEQLSNNNIINESI